MSLNAIRKRRASAGIGSVGVTPDGITDAVWRASVAGSYFSALTSARTTSRITQLTLMATPGKRYPFVLPPPSVSVYATISLSALEESVRTLIAGFQREEEVTITLIAGSQHENGRVIELIAAADDTSRESVYR